jgi:dTDP-4-amino-4,6-dideoxygalactose transaminase
MDKIKLIMPSIEYRDVEADFRSIFDSNWFSNGEYGRKFSTSLAEYTGARHAFLTSSCTTALWMCLKLLGVGPGDEVPVSDLSFPASANVIEDLGATPVFVDVCEKSFNMLPEKLEEKLTERTRAVMFVDAFGNPTNLSEIKELCETRGIPLLEDAACALGSAIGERRCGNIADLTCISFHPRKLLNCGEGGAILTNDDTWAKELEIKLMHGSIAGNGPGREFVGLGYNFRMSELQAALGLRQIPLLDDIATERNSITNRYAQALKPLGFTLQHVDGNALSNRQSVVFLTPESIDRNQLISALTDRGIESTLGTYSLSGTRYNRNKYGTPNPISMKIQDRSLTLPCFVGVDVDRVVAGVASGTGN